MQKKTFTLFVLIIAGLSVLPFYLTAHGRSDAFKDNIYPVKPLKPIDSIPKLKVGDKAPDFTLPSITGEDASLGLYLNKRNVVISFVPAAWTPVCSDQWPGYNVIKNIFDRYDTILLGITVDNIPTLFAWTNQMGKLWFPVLSDFWPHGGVAEKYGVLRSDGVSERALFVIDKQGVVRYFDVHDINKRPFLEDLVNELEKLSK
jgi:peroxiredoxin (alkyl hydroperoxide reductase subunit C)